MDFDVTGFALRMAKFLYGSLPDLNAVGLKTKNLNSI